MVWAMEIIVIRRPVRPHITFLSSLYGEIGTNYVGKVVSYFDFRHWLIFSKQPYRWLSINRFLKLQEVHRKPSIE